MTAGHGRNGMVTNRVMVRRQRTQGKHVDTLMELRQSGGHPHSVERGNKSIFTTD
jgi:hypothetical protein